MTRHSHTNHCGFTLLELLMVVGVGVLVTAVAVPNVVVAVSNSRLRASMTSLSGIMQSTRMLAVNQNRAMTTHITVQPQGIVAYAKLATNSTPVYVNDMQVEMEAPIIKVTTPSGVGAPPALSSAVLGFTPQTGDPSFNTRGMPCAYSAGTCINHGFAYYFHDNRPASTTGWSAVSISPAGRIKKWFWNGSAWID